MSTHAGALLLAALAYTLRAPLRAATRASPSAPASSAISPGSPAPSILAMIALLIGYEAVSRLFAPVPIHFAEAIPIACLGLAGQHRQRLAAERRRPSSSRRTATGMGTAHAHDHDECAADRDPDGRGHPRRCSRTAFRRASGFSAESRPRARRGATSVETVRPDGARQTFRLRRSRRLSGIASTKSPSRTHSPPT